MSKNTAISRKTLSAPAKWLLEKWMLVGRCLDYGCGRGFDADTLNMDAYDPNWRPERPAGKYDTIMCNYVLNVVTEEIQNEIIEDVISLLDDYGIAFFTVRRDIKEDKVGRNCIQRSVVLDAPFRSLVHAKGKYEIYFYIKREVKSHL